MYRSLINIVNICVCVMLAGCGNVYHVSKIISVDKKYAVTWEGYPGFFCAKIAPWRVFCDLNEYINPYTYNPEYVNNNNNLNGPSLYQLASSGDINTQFSVVDIQDPCKLAEKINNKKDSISVYLFNNYSTLHGKKNIKCDDNKKSESGRVAIELSTFLNKQINSDNIYASAGLNETGAMTCIPDSYFKDPCLLASGITNRENKLFAQLFKNYSTSNSTQTDKLRCNKTTDVFTVSNTLSAFLDNQFGVANNQDESSLSIIQKMNKISSSDSNITHLTYDDVIERCKLAKRITERKGAYFSGLFHNYSAANRTAQKLRCDGSDAQNAALEVTQLVWQQLGPARNKIGPSQKIILPEALVQIADSSPHGEALKEMNKNIISIVYKDYLRGLYDSPRLARNKLQIAIMGVSERNTAKHLAGVKATQTNLNLLFGLSTAGLAGGGSIAAHATAQALTAAAGGTNAARALVNDQVYRDILIESLINTIKVDRDKLRQLIEAKMGLSISEYDVEHAIYDALVYHEAGSFYSGLASMREVIEDGNKSRRQNITDAHTFEEKTILYKKQLEALKAKAALSPYTSVQRLSFTP